MDAPEGEAISPLQSLILDLPPSCIEFCPAHPGYFVVGTYYLERTADAPAEEVQPAGDDDDGNEDVSEAKASSPQSRNGSVIVFRLQDGNAYVCIYYFSFLLILSSRTFQLTHESTEIPSKPSHSHQQSLISTFNHNKSTAMSLPQSPAQVPSPSSDYPLQPTAPKTRTPQPLPRR